MERFFKVFMAAALLWIGADAAFAQNGNASISGVVLDAESRQPIAGANVLIEGTQRGTSADIDGRFAFTGLTEGTYTVRVSFISYESFVSVPIVLKPGDSFALEAVLKEQANALEDVVVVSRRKNNTDTAILSQIRQSAVVMSGVSSQQITRNQDRDASEIIRRIPGISIIDDKFVIVRGLSQRYNNVWINNAAVPSSEPDSRSFSFDVIPSSQIENMMIVKSPAPEIPADFTGGFIKITTKDMPDQNNLSVGYGMSVNTTAHFNDFKYNAGSGTDFLGFDSGKRGFSSDVPDRMDNTDLDQVTRVTRQGMNNDWTIRTRRPIPDQRFNFMISRRYNTSAGIRWGFVGALNYSNSSKSYLEMENSRYSIYDAVADQPDPIYKYTDNQYSNDVRLGAMLNFSLSSSGKSRYEFRNTFNQLGRNRLTERSGYQFISAPYNQEKTEYLYMSRTTYTGQVSGVHNFSKSKLDWNAGYSYANKRQPDRRIVNRQQDLESGIDSPYYGQMRIDQNEIQRDFSTLDEHIVSGGVNYTHNFRLGENFTPSLKTGLYGEYRTRRYENRQFYFRYDLSDLPDGFEYGDVTGEILRDENYGADKLYLYEETDNRNSYSGDNMLLAAYLGLNIPIRQWNIYAGVRFEKNDMRLDNYISINKFDIETREYSQADFFPSLNLSYNFTDKQLLRLAYGASVNRQEFRELSPSVYYDFDLFSDVKGNPNLKPAYIQNFELRYEYYPSPSESVSVALFYKYFKDPIEWSYLDAGGSYTFMNQNARSANNYGVEVDMKKNLGFIGLDRFTLSLNAAYIHSRVKFAEESLEHDRPMQGQSPFLVNAGLYYTAEKARLTVGALYNVIGKRIVGIGRVDTNGGGSVNNNIPDMYEMPRNVLDLNISKKLGRHFELRGNFKDILCEPLVFKQFPQFTDAGGVIHKREQVTKKYRPGATISLSLSMSF